MAVDSRLTHVLVGEPVPTSPEHALLDNPRSRVMPAVESLPFTLESNPEDSAANSSAGEISQEDLAGLFERGRRSKGSHARPAQLRSG
jgi:hypothetical protein